MGRIFERELALCFNSTDFERESFDPDSFVATQGRVIDLQVLVTDLRAYQAKVKNSLVEVINKDYQEFVDLSKTLTGINKLVRALHEPLGQRKKELTEFSTELENVIEATSRIIEQRRSVQERRKELVALKAVYTVLSSLEKTLLNEDVQRLASVDLDFLKRAGLELSSVKSKVLLCNPQNVNEVLEKRIVDVETFYLTHVGNIFTEAITEEDGPRVISAFQMYAAIDCMSAAEDLFRAKFVEPHFHTKILNSTEPMQVENVYEEVLNFFPQKALFVTRIANSSSDFGTFNFEVNAVFSEAITVLMQRFADVFIPSSWRQFKKNYDSSLKFLSDFENVLHSDGQVALLRMSAPYRRFSEKWSMPVYFQLIFQELVSGVEAAISKSSFEMSGESLTLVVPDTIFKCILQCWSDEAYIDRITHRLLKFTLQLAYRMIKWTQSVFTSATQKSIPSAAENGFTERDVDTTKVDHDMFVVYLLADVQMFSQRLATFFEGDISVKLSDCFSDVPESDTSTCMLSVIDLLTQQVPKIEHEVVNNLIKRCTVVLKPVSDIPRLFRKTNRAVPSTPSEYIKDLCIIITSFSKTFKSVLSPATFDGIITNVCETTSIEYQKLINGICENVEKIEQSLKKIKSTKSLKNMEDVNNGPSEKTSNSEKYLSDSEKMYLQLFLDVEHCHCCFLDAVPALASSAALSSLCERIKFASVYRKFEE